MAANPDFPCFDGQEPLPRIGHISGCVGNKHIVQGGRTKDVSLKINHQRLSSAVHVFDPSLEQWKQEQVRGDLPKSGTYLTASGSSLSGCIYSYGGYNDNIFFNTLFKLDPESKSWTLLSPQNSDGAPIPKRGCGMAVLGDSIVIVNGYGLPREPTAPGSFMIDCRYSFGSGWTNELHIYDLPEGIWSCPATSGESPPPCSLFTFTAIDEQKAVMFGGGNGEQSRMNNVYIFDISTMNWRRLNKSGSWPEVRACHAVCCLNYGQRFPHFLMSGGLNRQDQPLDGAWILDLEREKWTKVHGTLKGRWGHSLTAISLGPGLTEVMQFGGSYEPPTGNVATQTILADTTLFQFRLVESLEECQWELVSVADNKQIGSEQRVMEKYCAECKMQHCFQIEGELQRTKEEEGVKEKEMEKMRKWVVEKRKAVEEQERLKERVLEAEEERDMAGAKVVEVQEEKCKVEKEREKMRVAKERAERVVQELAREKSKTEYNLMLATNTIWEKEETIKKLQLEQEVQLLEIDRIKKMARRLEDEKELILRQSALELKELQNAIGKITMERDTTLKNHQALLQDKTNYIENLEQLIQTQACKTEALENEYYIERERNNRVEFESRAANEKLHLLQEQTFTVREQLQQKVAKVEAERDMESKRVMEVEAERDREVGRVMELEEQMRNLLQNADAQATNKEREKVVEEEERYRENGIVVEETRVLEKERVMAAKRVVDSERRHTDDSVMRRHTDESVMRRHAVAEERRVERVCAVLDVDFVVEDRCAAEVMESRCMDEVMERRCKVMESTAKVMESQCIDKVMQRRCEVMESRRMDEVMERRCKVMESRCTAETMKTRVAELPLLRQEPVFKSQYRSDMVEMELKKSIALQKRGIETDESKEAQEDKVVQPNLPEDDSVEEERVKHWAIAEKMVTITNEEQDIEWEGYGLKLHIPQNSLPEDVSKSTLQITVSIAEKYKLPTGDGILVSPIYSFNHSLRNSRLSHQVTVQIQSCAGCFAPLCLIRSEEIFPPFQFHVLEDKDVNFTGGYCSFKENHFCSFSVYLKWYVASLVWTLKPCAVLYYTNIQSSSFEFCLYVIPGLDIILKEIDKDVREKYKSFRRGPSTNLEYDTNEATVSLVLPQTPVDGWYFKCLGVEKMQIDDIARMQRVMIPFEVRVKWSGNRIKELECDIKISGTEGGKLTIISPSECTDTDSRPNTSSQVVETVGRTVSSGETIWPTSKDFADIQLPPPTVGLIMNVIGVIIQAKWRDIGLGLGLKPYELRTIKAQYRDIPQDCMTEVFTMWENRETLSWQKLATVICSDLVNEPALLRTMWYRLRSELQ